MRDGFGSRPRREGGRKAGAAVTKMYYFNLHISKCEKAWKEWRESEKEATWMVLFRFKLQDSLVTFSGWSDWCNPNADFSPAKLVTLVIFWKEGCGAVIAGALGKYMPKDTQYMQLQRAIKMYKLHTKACSTSRRRDRRTNSAPRPQLPLFRERAGERCFPSIPSFNMFPFDRVRIHTSLLLLHHSHPTQVRLDAFRHKDSWELILWRKSSRIPVDTERCVNGREYGREERRMMFRKIMHSSSEPEFCVGIGSLPFQIELNEARGEETEWGTSNGREVIESLRVKSDNFCILITGGWRLARGDATVAIQVAESKMNSRHARQQIKRWLGKRHSSGIVQFPTV